MGRFTLIIALLICSNLTAQIQVGTYKITRAKIVGWSVCAVAGAADGAVEGFEFDGRKSFERKYGVDKFGYFGSQSWRRVYVVGEPRNGFKSRFADQIGAFDFYHHADDVRKFGYITGGVVVGIGGAKKNTKWWHYAIDFGVSFGISAATKSAAMYWIRH